MGWCTHVNGSKPNLSNEVTRTQTNAGSSTDSRNRSHIFPYVNRPSEIASHCTPLAQTSVQDSFSGREGATSHLPFGRTSGTQFIPGIKPIDPPHFKDCLQSTQRTARERILDYRDRVKSSKFKHGTTSRPVRGYFHDEEGISFFNDNANARSGYNL